MSSFQLLKLEGVAILDQLRIEEALLRADERNWCIVNKGVDPSIVMGISAKADKLLNLPLLKQKPISAIKRFSGGGTVVVDQNTFFVTFICNSKAFDVPCFPEQIHAWAESFYRDVFSPSTFNLRENDYVFGERKFGGNAQYLRKERWLHHTSFLWDYDLELMEYLLLPEKRPKYRQERSHEEFLCSLKQNYSSLEDLEQRFLNVLASRFHVEYVALNDMQEVLSRPHRKATQLLNLYRT